MNKYIIVLALFLSACGSTCREKTATLNATLGEVVYQSNLAYDANYINVDSLRKIDAATDQAKLALDTARLMCVSGDKGFDAQISIVEGGLNSSLDILQVEIQHQFLGPYNDKQTLRSNDIFASLASRDREFPNFGRLVSASFSVKFENAKRPRMVKVRTPNVANFDRKEDSHLIETWLRKRGFVNEQKEEEDSTQPVTHQESHDAVSIAAMA